MPETKRRWIYRRASAAARLRLFCLPYAGGGAAAYSQWQDDLPDRVEVCAVQLHGRGLGVSEPAARNVPELVDALIDELEPYFDLPFAFFGHSLGALLGFELARRLKAQGGPEPRMLFLSAVAAPHLDRGSITGLPDARFLAEIRAYGGTPDELLENPELLELFLPVLRSDFALFEGYRFQPGPVPDCPVHLYGGEQDHKVTPARLAAWGKVLPIASTELFPGGHFYLAHERRALLASLARRLDAVPGADLGVYEGVASQSSQRGL